MKCLTCPTLPTHLELLFILTTEDIVPSVLVFAAWPLYNSSLPVVLFLLSEVNALFISHPSSDTLLRANLNESMFFLRKVNSWAVSWWPFPLCILLLGGCCSPTSAVISSSSIRMYCCLSSSEDNRPEWCMYWTHSKICLWTSQYLRWVYAIKLIMIGELPKWKHIIALLIFSLGKQR